MIRLKDLIQENTRPNFFGLGQLGGYDEIQFKWIPSIEHRGTEHSDKFSYRSGRRFRFYYGDDKNSGIIYWVTDAPTNKDLQQVEDYFNKLGININQRNRKADLIKESYD